MTDRAKVREMFKALRKNHGFFARMNYYCCSSCAMSAASQEAKKSQPVVYYHAQDAEAFEGQDLTSTLYVGYGVEGDEAEILKVGQIVAAEAKTAGLRVEWDGSIHTRIGLFTREAR